MQKINENCAAVRMLDESIKGAFKMCERIVRSVDWSQDSPEERKVGQAWLRGLLINAIFRAGDERQHLILKHFPKVRRIWKKEFAKAKAPPHRRSNPTYLALLCAAQTLGKYANRKG